MTRRGRKGYEFDRQRFSWTILPVSRCLIYYPVTRGKYFIPYPRDDWIDKNKPHSVPTQKLFKTCLDLFQNGDDSYLKIEYFLSRIKKVSAPITMSMKVGIFYATSVILIHLILPNDKRET